MRTFLLMAVVAFAAIIIRGDSPAPGSVGNEEWIEARYGAWGGPGVPVKYGHHPFKGLRAEVVTGHHRDQRTEGEVPGRSASRRPGPTTRDSSCMSRLARARLRQHIKGLRKASGTTVPLLDKN